MNCTKCASNIDTAGMQSEIAKALGLELCIDCWQDSLLGSSRSTTITKVAHLGVDGKVSAGELPGGLDTRVHATLSTGESAMAFATNKSVKVTPNAAATYTTTVPAAGLEAFLMVLTSGTTSRIITFGSGFKSTGTLTTGTTSGRVFVIHWISDGTNLYEAGRTVAMVE